MAKKKPTSKRRGRPRKPVTERKKANTATRRVDGPTERAGTGRCRCAFLIKGKHGNPDRQCRNWTNPGSEFCRIHGGAASHSALERSIEDGKGLREGHGFKRAVHGQMGLLFETVMTELSDNDLTHELAAMRTALMTQLDEMSIRYEEFQREAESIKDPRDRIRYWRSYNIALKGLRQSIEQTRRIAATIADIKHKESGNTLTMVQVVQLVGELIDEVVELFGDDEEKIHQLRAVLQRMDWMLSDG